MHQPGDPSETTDSSDQRELLSYYQDLSRAIMEADPEDVGRQIPGLVQDIATHSTDAEPTSQFDVGISFTKNFSLFDYSLIQLIRRESGAIKRETIKKPVSRDHHYLGFSYPPDPYFDNRALRGVILSVLTRRIREAHEASPNDGETVLSDMWGLLGDYQDD